MIFNKIKNSKFSENIFNYIHIFSESKILLNKSCILRLCYVSFGNAIGQGDLEKLYSVGDRPSRDRRPLRDDIKR